MVGIKDLLGSFRGNNGGDRGKHWCSAMLGSNEDNMNGIGDHYNQEERVFIPKSCNDQNKGGTTTLIGWHCCLS